MITADPNEFLERFQLTALDAPSVPKGCFLVAPDGFYVEAESAADNRYMDLEHGADPERALAQAHALAQAIMDTGVPVFSFPGRPDLPDGVFPNNAFATVPGRFITGAMLHNARRGEPQRADIRRTFVDMMGYEPVDLSDRGLVAELTGPLVIDRGRGVGFCGMSDRVDDAGCEAMNEAFKLNLTFRFDLSAGEYHTNVVMAVLASRAVVIHPPAFADPAVPKAIAAAYPQRCLELTAAEAEAFAGNCIALTERDLFMSRTGVDALRPEARGRLEDWGFVLHAVELDEIEKAGGSLRCMVAEIF